MARLMKKAWLLNCFHWTEFSDDKVVNEQPGVSFEVMCPECRQPKVVVGYGGYE